MAETVDTAAPLSPANEAERPQDARSVSPTDEAEAPHEARSVSDADVAEKPHDSRPAPPEDEAERRDEEAEEANGEKDAEEAKGEKDAEESKGEKDAEEAKAEKDAEESKAEEAAEESKAEEAAEEAKGEKDADEAKGEEKGEEAEEAPSVTQLFWELGRELGQLGVSEAQLQAAHHMPEVRRALREIVGVLVLVVAALAAFALLNVAAVDGLSKVVATWAAALVVAAVWTVGVVVLLFGFLGRARRWLLWIFLKEPPAEAVEELEQERDAAGQAALGTLERMGPAIAIQIALAAVPKAGEVASDVASGVIEVGDSVLDASDEIVEVLTEQIPGGGVVQQVWDVALMPGRFGVKVATTVLRRGKAEESADAADSDHGGDGAG
jgi:hypothetical protein